MIASAALADYIATALLLFDTPKGLRLNVSSLTSPNFAHTYTLGSVGLVDGSLSYLYTSLPIRDRSRSIAIDLRDVVEGYRYVKELKKPEEIWSPSKWERALAGRKGETLHAHDFQLLSARFRYSRLWTHVPTQTIA